MLAAKASISPIIIRPRLSAWMLVEPWLNKRQMIHRPDARHPIAEIVDRDLALVELDAGGDLRGARRLVGLLEIEMRGGTEA
jgi:hypothetical protein